MSAEKSRESAKFQIGKNYTRAEFLYRLELLRLSCPDGDELKKILTDNIFWAEQHPEETTFVWKESPDGRILPSAYQCLEGIPVFPEGPKVD